MTLMTPVDPSRTAWQKGPKCDHAAGICARTNTVPCAAKSKTTGLPCGDHVKPPAKVCYSHGGAAPQTKAAVERQRQEEALDKAVQTYGGPIDKPSAEVMADLIAASYGHIMWLRAVIASYPDLKSVPGFVLHRYDVERTLAARMTKDHMGADVDERRQKLAEADGVMLAGVVRNVVSDLIDALTDAGVSMEILVRIQRDHVPDIARRRLLEGNAGEVGP